MEFNGDRLINEAIKRILLDTVIRGHGDRLIGRWSREPEIQSFLEQVPYMLDRINQLHLACTRSEALDAAHLHHHHKLNRRHHLRSAEPEVGERSQATAGSISDFVGLLASDMHWLVRTRDPLGLTPLHKAVLHANQPIVEYIVDRYSGELAASSWQQPRGANKGPSKQQSRLIDAQDKYGRSALHYAAALLAASSSGPEVAANRKQSLAGHIYHFLLAQGANAMVRDFRGKTPAYYVRHPSQLRAKSIIHLANKLNANFQANVLSKTLRASSQRAPIQSAEPVAQSPQDLELGAYLKTADLNGEPSIEAAPEQNRESMSVSCGDLRNELAQFNPLAVSRSKSNLSDKLNQDECLNLKTNEQQQTTELRPEVRPEPFAPEVASDDSLADVNLSDGSKHQSPELIKWLAGERCDRLVMDQRTKLNIKRCLKDGNMDKINELLIEGHGKFIISEAATSCWNLHCKRYINNVIPGLLAKLDTLHESIARNDLVEVSGLLGEDPTLARVRRPYKRAASNALHLAVQLNRKRVVKYLVGRFPELVAARDSHGATCLHWAAKSQDLEQLYSWLNSVFGSQLEHLRDSRGKLASDYRQQAMKLSLGGGSNQRSGNQLAARGLTSTKSSASDDVHEILRRNQRDSNKLQLTGTKSTIINRKSSKTSGVATNRQTQNQAANRIKLEHDDEESRMLRKQNSDTAEISEDKSQVSTLSSVPVKVMTENETDGQPGSSTSHSLETSANGNRRGSRDEETQATSQNFLNEMVQVDSRELRKSSVSSSLASTAHSSRKSSVASQQAFMFQGQETTAQSSRKLDNFMRNAIEVNDFKKLEHLVLAGCGQRLLNVLSNLTDEKDSDENKQQVSSEMLKFIEQKVPNYMATIEKIHEVVHKCYANSDSDTTDLNGNFHKLCNLLNRNSLIMARDSFGASPLHVALMRSDKRLVDYLLRRHPEAASGPDHQNRIALHYAALTLAAYEHHGSFRLERKSSSEADVSHGFWLVDQASVGIYEDLQSRYRELTGAKDKVGLVCSDYLQQAAAKIHGDSQTGDLVFHTCCPDYAKLLSRYNYSAVAHSISSQAITQNIEDESLLLVDETRANELVELSQAQEQTGSETEKRQEKPISKIKAEQKSNSKRLMRRSGSCDDETARCSLAGTGSCSGQLKRKAGTCGRSSGSRPQTSAEDLLRQLDGELLIPANCVDLGAACARQMAPKPTVGSDAGFHPLPVSPTSIDASPLFGDSSAGAKRTSPASTSGGGHAHRRHHRSHHQAAGASSLLLDELDPNQRRHSCGHHRCRHSHHHRSHHYHHHHHHRCNLDRRKSPGLTSQQPQPTSSHQVVVGGVIVPTIIHNDKMDEIETYDIIYRAPPQALASSSAGGQNSGSGSGSDSDSCSSLSSASLSSHSLGLPSDEDDDDRDNDGGTNNILKEANKKSETQVNGGGPLNDVTGNSNRDVDYDDRVERLSSEFENRVRREKSELRAKVDQIMADIKLSSSTGSDKGLGHANPPTTTNTLAAIDKHRVVGNDSSGRKSPTSLNSSGHSSARTSTSSASSVLSNGLANPTANRNQQSTGSSSSSPTSTSGSSRTASSFTTTGTSSTTSGSKTRNEQQRPASAEVAADQQIKSQTEGSRSASPKQQTVTGSHLIDLTSQVAASKNAYGQTYLHFIASRSQSASTLFRVLDHGSHLIGERDIFYRTARDVAVQFNLPNNVQILDKFIIDLFIGANTSLLRHLLNEGYSPLIHVSDPDGNDIMLILKLLKLDRVIHFLLQMADFQRWRDELHTFIRHGYSAGVSELIRKHKDLVRAKSLHARTSVHLAVLFDQPEMLSELLEADPGSVHVADNMGRIPLHYTYGLSLKNADEIKSKLMACGSSLEARDVKMRTPKYYFIFKREIEEIKRIELELN